MFLTIVHIVILLLQKDMRTQQYFRDCLKEQLENGRLYCTCDLKFYNESPYIESACENTKLSNISAQWFTSKNGNFETHTLRFEYSQIVNPEENFLKPLGNLKVLGIKSCKGMEFMGDTYIPKSLNVLNVSNTPLPGIVVGNGLEQLKYFGFIGTSMQAFPKLSPPIPPVEKMNFDYNENIKIAYEEIVHFCKLRELYANQLVGVFHPAGNKKDFCNCVRLGYWLYENKIITNIEFCEHSLLRPLLKESHCSFKYGFDSYQDVDPCNRKIINLNTAPVMPWASRSKQKKSKTKLYLLVIIAGAICGIIIVVLLYVFYFYEKFKPETPYDSNEDEDHE